MKIFAIDIGGTKLKYALYDEKLNRLTCGESPSNAKYGAKMLIETAFGVFGDEQFDAIGISTAGMVNKDGSIYYANENIPNYTGVKLKKIFEERYRVPVFVLNDISAGAISETECRKNDFYYLSLGTGVGGVMVNNGIPYIGENGAAGQIGYLPSLNGKFCIDKAASVSALEKTGGKPAAELFFAALNNDSNARKIISGWAKEVVYAISLAVGFYNPPTVVIGGGISWQKRVLIDFLMKEIDVLPKVYRAKLEIETAKEPSGVKGAAIYAKRCYYGNKREN